MPTLAPSLMRAKRDALGVGAANVLRSWDWAADALSGMAAGEYKKLNTNVITDILPPRDRATFDADTTFADDPAVLAAVKSPAGIRAFSLPTINGDDGHLFFRGGGHTDSGDGSICKFDPNTGLWSLLIYPAQLTDTANGQATTVANVTAATNASPCVVTVDDVSNFFAGDQVTFASAGGMTELNTNSPFNIKAVDSVAKTITLGNIDSDASAGTGPTDVDSTGWGTYTSGGTATVQWDQTGGTPFHYIRPNKDGIVVPYPIHSYHHNKWIGGKKYLIAGESIYEDGGGQNHGQIWILDEDANPQVYRALHDTRSANGEFLTNKDGFGYGVGPGAYNDNDGLFYTAERTTTIFNFRLLRWASDFLSVTRVAFDGAIPGHDDIGADAVIFDEPGGGGTRNFFSHMDNTANDFYLVKDIEVGGTPAIFNPTYDGTPVYPTGASADRMCQFWDDLNGEIILGVGTDDSLSAVTPNATETLYSVASITGTPTGDLPSNTLGVGDIWWGGRKVPEHDAYMLVACESGGADTDGVWLYKRS